MLDLNLDDAEGSSTPARHVTLSFSILKSNDEVIEIEEEDDDGAGDDVISRRRDELQLFPLATAASSSSGRQGIRGYRYWLDLSLPESDRGAELGFLRGVGSDRAQPQAKKSRRGPRSRSSQYRGVTFYRRTGRWESHIWDCGKQVYLGGFDTAHAAARAYDRAAIKFRGVEADINFRISDYEEDMKQMKNLTKEEFVQILRRQVNGSVPGGSKYRGVPVQKYGHWEARLAQSLGMKAYDKEASNECNVRNTITNFRTSSYGRDMKISSKDGCSESGLDLKLGISLSSDAPQYSSKDTKRSLRFPYASVNGGKRLKVETNSVSTSGIGVRAGAYSGFAPNNQEIAVGISSEAVSPFLGNPTWSYKMESAIKSNVPQLISSAASSGFSCATSPYFASRMQFPKTAFNGLQ